MKADMNNLGKDVIEYLHKQKIKIVITMEEKGRNMRVEMFTEKLKGKGR